MGHGVFKCQKATDAEAKKHWDALKKAHKAAGAAAAAKKQQTEEPSPAPAEAPAGPVCEAAAGDDNVGLVATIDDVQVRVTLDTGADCTILSSEAFKNFSQKMRISPWKR